MKAAQMCLAVGPQSQSWLFETNVCLKGVGGQ